MSMNTITPQNWQYRDIDLKGVSWAGIGTCLTIPSMKLAFDVAQGLPFAFGMRDFLISHGHQDHAGGIPYVISQKALAGHAPARFFLPPPLVKPMGEILAIWQSIEGHQYEFELIPAEPGQDYELQNNLVATPFPTVHRVPSQGYILSRSVKKLREQYRGLSGDEIKNLSLSGRPTFDKVMRPLFAFTGDTQIEVLEQNPILSECQVLCIEVTYIDEKKSVTSAREWGHIHLDEILPLLPSLLCEKILLIHMSARHGTQELERRLDRALDPDVRARVDVFPR